MLDSSLYNAMPNCLASRNIKNYFFLELC